MAKKLGLCLGSGGARGIAHIGFLQALEENNIAVDCISGCSMGSLVGAMYLAGYTPKELKDIAISLRKNHILDISISAVKHQAILKSQKIDLLLEDYLGDLDFEQLAKPFSCIATDLVSGKIYNFTNGKVRTAVRASCSIPVAFVPVRLDDMVLVDGGISNRIPVAQTRELGADVVVAVDVLKNLPRAEKLSSIFDVGFRSLDVMSYNINLLHEDEQTPDLLLSPELGHVNQYKVEDQKFCYDCGYKLGLENIDKIKELLK